MDRSAGGTNTQGRGAIGVARSAGQQQVSDALDIDFADMPQAADRWLTGLDRIREAQPVFWSEVQHGWLITRHADVLDGFMGKLPLSSYRLQDFMFGAVPREQWAAAIPTLSRFVLKWIVNVDPPDHTRLRRLLAKAFSKKVVESVRPYVQTTIEQMLDYAQERGELEFAEEIARIIPSRTLFRLLGVPEEYIGRLAKWSVDLNTATSWPNAPLTVLQGADRVLSELQDLFLMLIEQRRRQPGEDLLSAMIAAVDEGSQLSEEEMVGICQILLIAGQDTTSNSLTLGVAALARWPEQLQWLREHPEQIDTTTMELSRHIAMSGGQTRVAAHDFEWHGQQVRRGDIVFLMIATANRDPRMFEAPLALNFERPHLDRVVTFGPGLHHCVGHLLARMQINEFNLRAYRRFRRIEPLDSHIVFNPGFAFRSPTRLRVKFES